MDAHLDFPEKRRRIFGRDGVDVEAGSPLEASDLRQPGNDFDVPMVVGQLLVVKRGGVNDVIIGGGIERLLELVENLAEDAAEVVDPGLRDVLEVAGMVLGEDPGLEREPAGIPGRRR